MSEREDLEAAFPWVHHLPDGKVRQFAADITRWRQMAEVYADPDLVSEALRPFREAAEQADPSKAAWMIANLELQAAAIRKSIAEGEQAMEQAMAGETPMVTIEDVLDGIPDAYEDAMENLEHARAGETIDEAEALLDEADGGSAWKRSLPTSRAARSARRPCDRRGGARRISRTDSAGMAGRRRRRAGTPASWRTR